MISEEAQAAEMLRKTREGLLGMVDDILVYAAYCVASRQEAARWERNCVNVTPEFAALFLVKKKVTFNQVCRMSS